MTHAPLDELLAAQLSKRQALSLRRQLCNAVHADAVHLTLDGKPFINFSSNDYLDLAHHPRLISAARRALSEFGVGSAASPLVTGHTALHAAAESAIARWKGTPASLLLPSGYQSAQAAVQTLAAIASFHNGGVRFLVDRLSHASLLDAVRASRCPWRIFPHNQMGKLSRLLEEAERGQVQVVITESIFSMDGDAAPFHDLAELKHRHSFTLLLDEAHASGVYGKEGAGLCAELGLDDLPDITIVTISKAMAGAGGAICASEAFRDAVVNWGRAYIYSTAVAPVNAAAAIEAIEVMRAEPWRQNRVRALARDLRQKLMKLGVETPPGDSPIIPIILGVESTALNAQAALRSSGLFTVAIRPPTVPKSSSRLRITLSCAHKEAEVDGICVEIAKLRERLGA